MTVRILARGLVGISIAVLTSCSAESSPDLADAGETAPISDDAWQALAAFAPNPLPGAPPDVSNAFADNPSAARLGQRLFFDPLFSGRLTDGDNDGSSRTLGRRGDTGKVACAGCHVATSGFVDTRSPSQQISLAAGWTKRRARSLLDVGQAKLLMWDGRRDALYNQVFGPLESPVEMNSSRMYVAEQVFARYRADYEALFGPMPPFDDTVRFPVITAQQTGCQPAGTAVLPACDGTMHGLPGDHAEFDALSALDQDAVTRVVVNFGKAIAAYERQISCGPSRFDAFMHGDRSALSDSEQRGASLFVGKARCAGCHSGPFMSDQQFHVVGLRPVPVAAVFLDDGDRGAAVGLDEASADPLNVRGKFSDGDDGRLPQALAGVEGGFRTPALRCVATRPSFMHTGQLRSLDDVVAFFNRGGDPLGYPGKAELSPLGLTANERADLVAFLRSLTGPGPRADLLSPPP